MLSIKYQKGGRDNSENAEKVVDSRMQIRFIACGYPPPFYYLQEIVDNLFETFQPGSGYPLKKGLHAVSTINDYPQAFERLLGEL